MTSTLLLPFAGVNPVDHWLADRLNANARMKAARGLSL